MRILNKKTIWRGKHISTVLISYSGPDGIPMEWEAVERVHASEVVIIVPFTTTDELVLIRQYRPAMDSYVIELPAGLVDSGESHESAARRELLEETGYMAGRTELLLKTAMSSGIHSEPWHVFVSTGAAPASAEDIASCKPDENEEIETVLVSGHEYKAELRELAGMGELVDIRIFGLVELALESLKENDDGSA